MSTEEHNISIEESEHLVQQIVGDALASSVEIEKHQDVQFQLEQQDCSAKVESLLSLEHVHVSADIDRHISAPMESPTENTREISHLPTENTKGEEEDKDIGIGKDPTLAMGAQDVSNIIVTPDDTVIEEKEEGSTVIDVKQSGQNGDLNTIDKSTTEKEENYAVATNEHADGKISEDQVGSPSNLEADVMTDADEDNNKKSAEAHSNFSAVNQDHVVEFTEKAFEAMTPPVMGMNTRQEEHQLEQHDQQQQLFSPVADTNHENGEDSDVQGNGEHKHLENGDGMSSSNKASAATQGKNEPKKTKLCDIL